MNDEKRILLVEDDDDLRWVFAECLRGSGYDVIDVPSAQAARQVVDRTLLFDDAQPRIHVLVTDVLMPMIDNTTTRTNVRRITLSIESRT